jgi:hypothetical protein
VEINRTKGARDLSPIYAPLMIALQPRYLCHKPLVSVGAIATTGEAPVSDSAKGVPLLKAPTHSDIYRTDMNRFGAHAT